jgi:hypothetical protein
MRIVRTSIVLLFSLILVAAVFLDSGSPLPPPVPNPPISPGVASIQLFADSGSPLPPPTPPGPPNPRV